MLGIPDQIVGLTLADDRAPGFGSSTLGCPGGEEGRPLAKLRSDIAEQPPGADRTAAPVLRTGTGRQHSCRCTQSRQVSERVTLPADAGSLGIGQTLPCRGEQPADGPRVKPGGPA